MRPVLFVDICICPFAAAHAGTKGRVRLLFGQRDAFKGSKVECLCGLAPAEGIDRQPGGQCARAGELRFVACPVLVAVEPDSDLLLEQLLADGERIAVAERLRQRHGVVHDLAVRAVHRVHPGGFRLNVDAVIRDGRVPRENGIRPVAIRLTCFDRGFIGRNDRAAVLTGERHDGHSALLCHGGEGLLHGVLRQCGVPQEQIACPQQGCLPLRHGLLQPCIRL